MGLSRTALLGFACLAAGGCAALAPPRHKPAPAKTAAVAVPASISVVTPAERKEIDRQYFEAVSAYLRGDAIQARVWINRILDVDPAHADAISLKRRLDAVAKTSK